jgi:hypothetical protein
MLPGTREITIQQSVFGYLEDGASSTEMAIDGSITPVRFSYRFAPTNRHLTILNSVLTLSGGKLDDPALFGGLAVALTNGCQMGWTVKSGDTEVDYPALIPFKNNYDLVSFASNSKPWGFTSDTKDVMICEFFQDFLPSIDPLQITSLYLDIQDDLTGLDSMHMALRGHS